MTMIKKYLNICFLVLVVMFLLSSNLYLYTEEIQAEQYRASEYDRASEYIVGSPDIVDITVWGHADLSKTVVVAPDGLISFPLIGEIHAAGLTTSQIEDKIRACLAKDYIVDPKVAVTIIEYKSKRFFMFGEVRRVGSFPLEKDITLLRAVTIAGGFTEFAAPSKVRLLRKKGRSGYITIRVNIHNIVKEKRGQGDILLKTDDIIIIPESIL
ncbi:MAG: polysaccharide biosynthesis/export family protein [bacterium]|nr:polysaccharide biosynthesis/export family protein [bacterium]